MINDNNQLLYNINNLHQIYNGRTILNINHLSIYKQEILAIVGPNGAGKSTLLRILNFLEAAHNGQIYFDGESIEKTPSIHTIRKVAMMFQNPQLLNKSVRSNIEYGLKIRGKRSNELVLQETLKNVGLIQYAQNKVSSLSGGELQRVAIARTLILNTKALLLDEPTSNLDPYNTDLIEQLIRTHHKLHKSTIVLVTHNLHQARRLAHRCALLLDGNLIEISSTKDFFEKPNDKRVSEFIHGKIIY